MTYSCTAAREAADANVARPSWPTQQRNQQQLGCNTFGTVVTAVMTSKPRLGCA